MAAGAIEMVVNMRFKFHFQSFAVEGNLSA